MPPVNDAFANATVLALGSGTVSGDNTDATSDGANDPLVNDGFGVKTVWYVIENPEAGLLTVGTSESGGSPIVDSAIGVYQGTTLAGLALVGTDDDGGPGNYSLLTDLAITAGDPIYIEVTGYDDTFFGTFTLTWDFSFCLDAVDLINPAASSRFDGSAATVQSGRVRETWEKYWDLEAEPQSVEEWSLKWTWAGAAGQYKVEITGQAFGTPVAGNIWALFRVNGKQVTAQTLGGGFDTVPFSWQGFDGQADPADWDYADQLHEMPWLVLKPGDLVEVLLVSIMRTSGFAFVPFECDTLCFSREIDAPATTYCTGAWDWQDHPLGDAWGSPNGWGGQRLVPDEITTIAGITPYDEGNFPWGIAAVDYDMAALADGTVYVILRDVWSHGLSSGFGDPNRKTPHYNYVVVKKYDPGAGSWSQIHTVNTNTPTQAYTADAVSCELGPDGFVYFSWWEVDTYYTGPDYRLWKWHLIKLDPSDDSYVELGTGQNAYTPPAVAAASNYSGNTLANSIAVAFNGDVFVATIEDERNTPGAGDPRGASDYHHCVVWRWNGATWSNLALPAPADIGVGTYYEVNGENSFYDRVPVIVCARHGEGEVTDGITLVYPYDYMAVAPPSFDEEQLGATIRYTVGTGWHDEFVTDWSTKIDGDLFGGTAGVDYLVRSRPAFDVDVMWHSTIGRLVLVTDFIGPGGNDGPWMVWKLNATGDDWVPVEDAPASVSGPWRQTRNTSAIGPDGNVYRGMYSEWNNEISFIPRIAKHSPGYAVGFAGASRKEFGQETNKLHPWTGWMFSTANYRLRIVGQNAYVMLNAYAESTGYGIDETEWADAIYVFKLTWAPCGGKALSLSHVRTRNRYAGVVTVRSGSPT